METNNYEAKAMALLDALSERGYSAGVMGLFRCECDRLVSYLSSSGTLDDYLQGYEARCGLKLYPSKRSVINAIRSWFDEGLLPSRRHPLQHKPDSYRRLSDSARTELDLFLGSCGSGWAESSVKSVRHKLSSYLLYLQQSGSGLSDITEAYVWAYFYDPAGDRFLRGSNVSYAICRFHRWGSTRPGGEWHARLLPMIPVAKRPRKVFDCLSAEEDGIVLDFVLDGGSGLSLRDAAIFVLARFCGLRACDIASLRMSDIDLADSCIRIRQRKTGTPLEMALRPVVGNAICRYVMQERPSSELPELFLIDEREQRPLTPGTVGRVCSEVYRKAGVRQEAGRRRGSHLLRHRFAQSLVEAGACDAAAMRLLGHASPSSLGVYLETDMARLRDCAISISGFPVGKEVLG